MTDKQKLAERIHMTMDIIEGILRSNNAATDNVKRELTAASNILFEARVKTLQPIRS